MRYSPALVLSTLAVGQAAAAHNHRHASFHARRNGDAKRSPGDYDVSNVNWDAALKDVDWNGVFNTEQAAPAPTPSAVAEAAEVYSEVEVKTSAAPEPTSQKEAASSKTATPTPDATSSGAAEPTESSGGSIGDLVGGVAKMLTGVESVCERLGVTWSSSSITTVSRSANIKVGSEGKWKVTFQNNGTEDMHFTCWEHNNLQGMIIKENEPAVLAYLPAGGDPITLSFEEKTVGACAPIKENTSIGDWFGGLAETWWEYNFVTTFGTFDVSRHPNMHGNSIHSHSQGSSCTSSMEECVFECVDKNVDYCTFGYELKKCDASNGGGQGYDPNMQGVGGGCTMGGDGDEIAVTFS